ncbi:hypothetical protein BKA81DRAFT_100021 [Phyllosticta paracitricarpa]
MTRSRFCRGMISAPLPYVFYKSLSQGYSSSGHESVPCVRAFSLASFFFLPSSPPHSLFYCNKTAVFFLLANLYFLPRWFVRRGQQTRWLACCSARVQHTVECCRTLFFLGKRSWELGNDGEWMDAARRRYMYIRTYFESGGGGKGGSIGVRG